MDELRELYHGVPRTPGSTSVLGGVAEAYFREAEASGFKKVRAG